MERILRVNMTDLTVTEQSLPNAYRLLGGRALTSRIACDEIDPMCDPLGPGNKLIFAPGFLSGTTASSSSRVSVGCKSPLTGGIKEANGGGQTGLKLAQLGYRALIVEGQPRDPSRWYLLVIDPDGPRLESGDALRGLDTQDTGERLFALFGKKIAVSAIGPAGEMCMNLSGICNSDPQGRMSRINARGGVGAVMGSKLLKAIVYLQAGEVKESADPAAWKAGVRSYHQELQSHSVTAKYFPDFGTAITLETVNKFGGLPVRNFTRGADPEAMKIGGIAMRDRIQDRGGAGKTTHACMAGCITRCSNVWADSDGREVASAMEFETNVMLGSNLEIFDFDDIARFVQECNRLGIDTIETGGTLGIAMEAGVIPWGDAAGVLRLLGEIRTGTSMGKLMGAGGVKAARELGVPNVAAVKNQMMPAYDPRVIKGNGVTYATSPMGADHTAGNTIKVRMDHRDPNGKVPISRELQILCAVQDSMGVCIFNEVVWDARPELLEELCRARCGVDLSYADLLAIGEETIRAEVSFNRKAGLGPETDRVPTFMCQLPLPPTDEVFDIPDTELDGIWGAE